MSRIDVHHHFIPQVYAEAWHSVGGDPSGWHLPKWTPEGSLELMKAHDTGTSILSVTAPGATILKGSAAIDLCRKINIYAAKLCKQYPQQFGFFATLPSPFDSIDAVIEEIAYSLDVLKADGVTLFTRYGPDNHYLGHPDFRRIWEELNKRRAVAFIHPTHSADVRLVNPSLPQPVIDYPHETTRTAVDLISSGTVKANPNVKIILSHAGGNLPYLATRAANLTADAGLSAKPASEFLDEARSFYFDLALSGNPWTMDFILRFAKPGHVLYGSDFPYAPRKTIDTHVGLLNSHERTAETEQSIASGAALKLFPRLKEIFDSRA